MLSDYNNSILSDNVVVLYKAYKSMMDFALKHPRNEIIGVFFGIKENSGDLFVKEAYPFRAGRRKDVEFIDDDYIKVIPLIKECAKIDLKWLGWFHSHPFRHGDHLYMSNVDVSYHQPAQTQNPNWTAIVLNPHQIDDTDTNKGMRAFRMVVDRNNNNKPTKIVKKLNLKII